MRKFIVAMLFAVLPGVALAAGGGVHLDKANIDPSDNASLQNGAKLFVNYCLSCHSAKYQRYNRMGSDLGLSDEQVKGSLMFASEKVGDTMTIAMSDADAEKWFGAPPPDLSVISRARGVDWLYTYLRTFHEDANRPFGVNNTVFKDVGMPHVLAELQDNMGPAEYDGQVRDLVNYLAYMGDPVKLERERLGIWVLLFLAVLFVVTYALKKEYWKDIH
ncbi:cytochrome c1 [Solemya pervernicosa gill symbiont]|uniref:Cytochrome c1 n=2 Tax=Gammaproteobacteria incertae sedis TaxID=118884 RepID=A0A1T2L9Z5_9GAMM|nr:cytochrome c1 [Candidatus Reidiella endopervernicosa]OOZ41864.1 cytochrome c1 [Solemya pervernicosa gill symbiont]QKQ26181.1 cytochrome c1 [Candidatus Reidiella endopervernicosa]